MRFVIVYNKKSGSSVSRGTLKKYFDAAKLRIEAFVAIDEELAKNLAPYCKKGYVVAAVGGDGTVGAVAAIVRGTEALLAPLPGGTLNHFTKDAGINQDLKQAINNLSHAGPRRVDVAFVNDHLFLNNSSIGIYPSSLQQRRYFESRLGKWPAAVIASIRAFLRFRLYEVTVNNESFETPFVFIGNNIYDLGSGGERKSLTQGKLCIYIIASDKRRSIFRVMWHALRGKPTDAQELSAIQATKLTIHARRNHMNISVDGELIREKTPLIYESHQKSLTIL